jgi:hypothetical protein
VPSQPSSGPEVVHGRLRSPQFWATFRTAPQEVWKTLWGIGHTTFFPAGTDLYRFLSPQAWHFDLLVQDATARPFFPGSRTISDFWMDHETFADIRRWAHESELPISTAAHSGLGVKYKWNPSMAEFGRVMLSACGSKGSSNRKMFDRYLSGPGIQQIWMPNITTDVAAPVGRAKIEALVPSFAEVGKNPGLRSVY